MTRKKTWMLLTTVAALAAATGCHHNDGLMHGEVFDGSEQTTSIGQVAQAQAAAGAKADSMLYDRHFTGTELNALGQAKMDLILKGSPTNQPVKVYFVMPHDQVALRQNAVAAYLDKAGIFAANEQFAEGPNPADTTPAVYNLAGIYSIQNNSYSGQAADLAAGK